MLNPFFSFLLGVFGCSILCDCAKILVRFSYFVMQIVRDSSKFGSFPKFNKLMFYYCLVYTILLVVANNV